MFLFQHLLDVVKHLTPFLGGFGSNRMHQFHKGSQDHRFHPGNLLDRFGRDPDFDLPAIPVAGGSGQQSPLHQPVDHGRNRRRRDPVASGR